MDSFFNEKIHKIILSKPVKSPEKNAGFLRVEILRNGGRWQATKFTQKQNFHENLDAEGVRKFLDAAFGAEFLHYTAWCGEYEYSARVSKKGKILSSRRKMAAASAPREENFDGDGFNRRKNYIVREDEIPAPAELGVFSRDKFRQVNRFLELLSDETRGISAPVNIIDFGCGKSCLTFAVYHYFAKIRGLRTSIIGLDSNETLIEKCTAAAKKYACDGLEFRAGEIESQTAPPLEGWGAKGTFNIVISLHACDTATDHALFHAVRWGADAIFAAPCCQHELRTQMKPRTLEILSDYGIIEERIAALATDAIRAKALEAHGYKTQIIEFTLLEHTQKNLLIRARRCAGRAATSPAMKKIRAIVEEFGFEPTILRLLGCGL